MSLSVVIRPETAGDAHGIAEVTAAAFRDLEVSDQTEPFIVAALRDAGALVLSLVAEVDGRLVGHAAFSPVTLSDATPDWYGVGPVSVEPRHQRQGVGRALMETGLSMLRARGARGCCLVGHPDYYPRFGFYSTPELVFEGVPPEAFMVLPFTGEVPRGTVAFHQAFAAKGAG